MKHLAAGLLLFCWLPLWGQVTNFHYTILSIDAGLSDFFAFIVKICHFCFRINSIFYLTIKEYGQYNHNVCFNCF